MNANNVAITPENFQQVILEDSKMKLVFVDFWAEQVPESVELRDKLATQLASAGEQVIYATVDCQAQQQIAMQFGIQGLPTAIVVKDGQPIDGVSGPLPDEAITEFLEKHLPKPQDELLIKAKQAIAENEPNLAYTLAKQTYDLDPERADIKLTLAEASLMVGKIDDAKALLDTVMMIDQDSYYHALIAKLELAIEAADSPEIKALEKAFAQQPDNVELIHQLAAQYNQNNRQEEALTLLFRRVQSVRDDEESKKLLLDVLKALPEGDALATKYRRKLYTLMY
ncbi:tetratricopeptide repeat protein [Thalassotalea atypica]|uniref:tetratricopeptide repeat protein n=1 Tax=Thalassotalea atypica TaxID=2054316 RepID=UPI0025746619|nr:tetratricopeptide repeat protein [Thalassotalea atypica]